MPSKGPTSGTGVLAEGDVQQIQTSVDALLTGIAAAVPGYRLGVTSNLGTGTERNVIGARYGRVLDTVRSRREKFTENYYAGTLSTLFEDEE